MTPRVGTRMATAVVAAVVLCAPIGAAYGSEPFAAAPAGGSPASEIHGVLGTPPGRNGLIAFTRDCVFDIEIYACVAGVPGVYTVQPDGRRPRRLLDDRSAGDPAFSRDGSWIAFESERDGDFDVYLMRLDGSEVKQVTDDPADDYLPQWLSDGRIVFTSERDGEPDTYVVDSDGTNVLHIGDTTGAASTDGKRIAVGSCPAKGRCDIYLYRPDGGLIRRLTRAPGNDSDPQFSPNGKRIVFVSTRRRKGDPASTRGLAQIYVMRSDGSHQTRLTKPHEQDGNYDPAFSPDGRQILFSRYAQQVGPSLYSAGLVVIDTRSGKAHHIPTAGEYGVDSGADWQSLPGGRR